MSVLARLARRAFPGRHDGRAASQSLGSPRYATRRRGARYRNRVRRDADAAGCGVLASTPILDRTLPRRARSCAESAPMPRATPYQRARFHGRAPDTSQVLKRAGSCSKLRPQKRNPWRRSLRTRRGVPQRPRTRLQRLEVRRLLLELLRHSRELFLLGLKVFGIGNFARRRSALGKSRFPRQQRARAARA
jgi:hypothetical protein